MKILYFQNVNSIDDLKHQYKNLAKKYHPDRGGNTEIMKIINLEYEYLSPYIFLHLSIKTLVFISLRLDLFNPHCLHP